MDAIPDLGANHREGTFRTCLVEVRSKGTWRRPCSVERRERELRGTYSVGHRAQQDRPQQSLQAARDQCSKIL